MLARTGVPFSNTNAPVSKVHGANMGPTWVLSAPDGPHVGPMNLAILGIHHHSKRHLPVAHVGQVRHEILGDIFVYRV